MLLVSDQETAPMLWVTETKMHHDEIIIQIISMIWKTETETAPILLITYINYIINHMIASSIIA